ncbi:auxin response factor 1-like [Prunus yedoensis var. nudiflora]|uniref:Auxin response factor 1-like n=1 Tax=Prunus yedoensis var. nudiflora TaxID=2094558 RepID=A0A314Y050_PRUYE|nr:auxin response factor 1-like [Prunus yedoensis var. nudiflora]
MAPRATAGVEGLGATTVNIAERESSGCSDGSAFPAAAAAANMYKRDEKDDSYTRLWHACAGPNVYVPRPGEKVFYFPQGHVEQVEAYANEDGKMEMPIYNLPSKILCNVVCVLLKAEVHTDEVFAQITLLPLTEQEQLSLDEENNQPVPQSTSTRSFSKTLTPSDTSTHGGFSVPKRQADECLPPLDMSQQPPVQELVARDLQGFEWHFRHIFRGIFKFRHSQTSNCGSSLSIIIRTYKSETDA